MVNSTKKEVPLGVKVAAIFNFILAICIIIFEIYQSIWAGFKNYLTIYVVWGIPIFIFYLIFFLIFFIFGIYIWEGKNWARILEIILFISSFAFFIYTIINDRGIIYPAVFVMISIPFVIAFIIALYLLFNKKVKEYFS